MNPNSVFCELQVLELERKRSPNYKMKILMSKMKAARTVVSAVKSVIKV